MLRAWLGEIFELAFSAKYIHDKSHRDEMLSSLTVEVMICATTTEEKQ